MAGDPWAIVAGVVMSALLALAPWMFMVHAKLAVLAAQMASIQRKMDDLIEANQERLPTCALHEARLGNLDRQVDDLSERLRDTDRGRL